MVVRELDIKDLEAMINCKLILDPELYIDHIDYTVRAGEDRINVVGRCAAEHAKAFESRVSST